MGLQTEVVGNDAKGWRTLTDTLNDVTRDLTTFTNLSLEATRRKAKATVAPDIRYGLAFVAGGLLGVAGIIQLTGAAAMTLAPNPISAAAWSGAFLFLLGLLPWALHRAKRH